MTARELVEFRNLRATIRERGTARVYIFAGGIAAWGALAIATAALASTPLATLLPLLVLAGAFEAVFALHVGVERIGRYLQVFYDDRWEHAAMAFGAPLAGTGTDPLFILFFGLATICNFAPVLLAAPVPVELAVIGGAHALFLGRLVVARRAAGRQRAADLERFRSIKEKGDGSHFTNVEK